MSTTSNHLVIFTPLALTIDNGVLPSSKGLSEYFSEWLAAKAQAELDLYSVAIKSAGGSNLETTFDNFLRALKIADCAIIIIPGKEICLLDAIYPRLLVYLTINSWWLERLLLVGLGNIAHNGNKFDPMIFSHPPVIFSDSPKQWGREELQWEEIVNFIHRKCYK